MRVQLSLGLLESDPAPWYQAPASFYNPFCLEATTATEPLTFTRCQASSAPHRPMFALFSAWSSKFFLYSLLSSEHSMAFLAHSSTIHPECHMIRSVTVIPCDLAPISLLGTVSYFSVKTPWWIATWGGLISSYGLYSIIQGCHRRNLESGSGCRGPGRVLPTGLFSVVRSACFLVQPRTTSLRVAQSIMVWAHSIND